MLLILYASLSICPEEVGADGNPEYDPPPVLSLKGVHHRHAEEQYEDSKICSEVKFFHVLVFCKILA